MRLKKPLLKFVSLSWVIFLKFDDGDGSNLCRVKPFVGYQWQMISFKLKIEGFFSKYSDFYQNRE